MFTIGLFSTHIPYLVFFFFYLSYFFFNSQIVEKKEVFEEFIFGKKEVVVEFEQENDSSSCHYDDLVAESIFTIPHEKNVQVSTNCVILGPGDRLAIAHFHEKTGLIVNRPPPFC